MPAEQLGESLLPAPTRNIVDLSPRPGALYYFGIEESRRSHVRPHSQALRVRLRLIEPIRQIVDRRIFPNDNQSRQTSRLSDRGEFLWAIIDCSRQLSSNHHIVNTKNPIPIRTRPEHKSGPYGTNASRLINDHERLRKSRLLIDRFL